MYYTPRQIDNQWRETESEKNARLKAKRLKKAAFEKDYARHLKENAPADHMSSTDFWEYWEDLYDKGYRNIN